MYSHEVGQHCQVPRSASTIRFVTSSSECGLWPMIRLPSRTTCAFQTLAASNLATSSRVQVSNKNRTTTVCPTAASSESIGKCRLPKGSIKPVDVARRPSILPMGMICRLLRLRVTGWLFGRSKSMLLCRNRREAARRQCHEVRGCLRCACDRTRQLLPARVVVT